MRSFVRSLSLVAVLALLPQIAEAQQRRITGRVTATGSGEPLLGASITIVGTALGTYTNEQGQFSIQAPASDVTVRVRRLGFRGATLAVPTSQSDLNVALERDVLQLEETVITGEATTVARQNAANDVATVSSADLNRAPAQTIEAQLQGKIAGALVQANSGAPGGGMQVVLRGITTINASVDPLFVIDGVVISNDAIASGVNAVTAAAQGGNASNQDNPVNRIADINPSDIERIEVLKGASASAIYGSKAANGVIIITTKQGTTGLAGGRPQMSLVQRVGTYALANKFGARNWTLPDALARFAPTAADTATIQGYFNAGKIDIEQELFGEKELSYETNLSLRGAAGSTRYFASGLVKHDGGLMKGTGYDKRSVRLNVQQLVGTRLTLNLNSNFVNSLAQRGLSNNDNAGVSYYMVLPFTPDFVDLRPRNGVYPENPFERSNPFQTRDLSRNDENVNRFIGGGSARYDLIAAERHSLSLLLNGGVDQFTQRNHLYYPPDLFFEDDDTFPGTAIRGAHTSVNTNVNLTATHTFLPASNAFQATTSIGTQRGYRRLNSNNIITRDLIGRQENITQGAKIEVFENREMVRDLSFFLQEQVLTLGDRLFLSGGVRAERNSSNGDAEEFFLFPKAAASFRFPAPAAYLSELKLRAAWGQTGNPPLYGQKFTAFATEVYDTRLSTRIGLVKGNPNIEPERQTEIELGIDGTAFGDRATIGLTVYEKTIDNLILQRTVAPSSGYQTELFNGAKLRNRGIEASLAAVPMRSGDMSWVTRVTFAANRSKVTELPVPPFETGGFGTALGAFRIELGKSATQIVGLDGDETVVVGDAAPDFQMSFSSDLAWGPWRLYGLLDWKKGGDVINLTNFLYDLFRNSPDFGGPDSPGAIRRSRLGTHTQDYVEDAGYFKVREITLGYELPPSVLGRFLSTTRSARIELSGRNLFTATSYSGVDPEVSNFGNQAIARNIDVAPYPPSRSVFLTFAVDF